MNPRDVSLAVAQLARGREVRVVNAKGAAYEPPAPPAPPPAPAPDAGEQLTRVEQNGVATRAALMEVSASLAGVTEAVQAVVSGQKEIVDGAARIERTLNAPVEPVYDGAGKITGARRVQGA